jgi:hypothetical protein
VPGSDCGVLMRVMFSAYVVVIVAGLVLYVVVGLTHH